MGDSGRKSLNRKDGMAALRTVGARWKGCQHYRILTHRFSLLWNAPDFQRLAEDLYPNCRTGAVESPQVTYSLYRKGQTSYLFRGEKPVVAETVSSRLFPYLEWAVTEDAMGGLGAFYQLHASAVARDGCGILLPAESGCGKTSLAVALCLNGFSPLDDDITMIDPDCCELVAFPRSFLIKEGILQVLPELKVLIHPADNLYWRDGERIWYLPRERLADTPTDRIEPKYLVFPHHSSTAKTQFSEIGETEALEALITKSFNFSRFKRRGVELLSKLVRKVRSFRLTYRDIGGAVEAISALFCR